MENLMEIFLEVTIESEKKLYEFEGEKYWGNYMGRYGNVK
jgi:hypothetical protein